ncbi:MAG TPA: ABC transporter permease [Verrucomicrobiae bacterium]|jgi:peptide/nickel transport system permease protein|nr:ABC transporter permease [Verrucomicrobiae bacterium]
MIDETGPKRRRTQLTGVAWFGVVWIALAVLGCALIPLAFGLRSDLPDVANAYAGPTWAHWLGTDRLGRDELARLLVGGRVTLAVGAIAATVAMLIGTIYGALAGYYGGVMDTILMRLVDVFLSIPTLFLLLFLAALFHGNLITLMIVIGATSWLGPARLVRGEVLTLKERLYVEAARAVGADDARIIFGHVVPNAFGTIVTTTTFMVATAMLAETALSYLGIGVQPPTPSWGNLLTTAQSDLFAGAWWLILPPGLAILVTVCAFNFVGDWLRDSRDAGVVGS